MSIIHADAPDLLEQVRTYIGNGAYLDLITDHGESALRAASNNGRFDVVALLLECGAAEYRLEWTTSIEQAVFGTLDSLRASVLQRQDLEFGDFWERIPLLMAILAGDIGKVALLLSIGANRHAKHGAGYELLCLQTNQAQRLYAPEPVAIHAPCTALVERRPFAGRH